PADVYALGVVMFEMAAGRRPFRDDDPMREAQLRLTGPVPSPGADVDPAWARLIQACLQKRPSERPSAAELRDGFATSSETQPIFRRRSRAWWWLALAPLAAL